LALKHSYSQEHGTCYGHHENAILNMEMKSITQLLAGVLNSAEAPIVKTVSTNISANITCIKILF